MKQSQYNQVPSVQGRPNVHGTFVSKNFTVTHFTSLHFKIKLFKIKIKLLRSI